MRPCKTLQLQQFRFGGFLKSFLCFKNFENLNFCIFHPIWVKFDMGANIGERTTQNVFEMATAIFRPTQLTYQSRPIVNLFNFCVFHPILIRFGLGANLGLKRTWNKLEITKDLCRPKADPRRALRRPKADSRTALFSRIYIYISLFIQPYTQEESQMIYILRVLKST